MMPFLEQELSNILKSLLENIVKPAKLGSSPTLPEMLAIDLDKEQNMIDCKNVCIGLATKEALSRLNLSEAKLREFKSQCQNCYKVVVKKLAERFSTGTIDLLSCFGSLNPRFILDHPNQSVARFENLVICLIQKELVKADKADAIMSQYKEINRKVRSERKHESLQYVPTKNRIDSFYYELIGEKSEYNGKSKNYFKNQEKIE